MSEDHRIRQDLRRARLEEELRENLKRRKEQARARRSLGPPDETGARPPAAPDPEED